MAVGSTNPVKINTVRLVFRALCNASVKGVEVESGVPDQPLGFREVLLGAVNRAVRARDRAGADYGVGIEAGAVEMRVGWLELQAAAIVDSGGRLGVGLSPAFPVPSGWERELARRVELGVLAEKATRRKEIGKKLGLIGYLTQGMVTRTDLSRSALLMAIIPFTNPALYRGLPSVGDVLARLAERA